VGGGAGARDLLELPPLIAGSVVLDWDVVVAADEGGTGCMAALEFHGESIAGGIAGGGGGGGGVGAAVAPGGVD